MKWQMLYFMIIAHFLYLYFIARLHIPQYFQVTIADAVFEYGSKDHIGLIKREIDDKRVWRFSSEFKIIQHLKFLIKNLQGIGPSFQHIVFTFLEDIG